MIEWDLVHIPKTGGYSIFSAIGYREQDHRRASECRGFLATFVRNPLSRFVSAFEFLRDPKWKQLVIPADTKFREFVLSGAFKTADTKCFYPMTYWLDAPVGFVGRFEDFQQDFDRLCSLIGMKQRVPLPRLHVRDDSQQWKRFYDPETLQAVSDYYADDIVRFGYGPEVH